MRFVEAVIALALGIALLLGTWVQATSVRRQSARVGAEAANAEARRVVGLLVDLDAGGVQSAAGFNELAVRAYRWWGRPCWSDGRGLSVHLDVSGLRRPAHDKDSLLLIDVEGRSSVVPLVGTSRSRRCPGDAVEVRWDRVVSSEPVLVRGFERGVYRLDAALRYRRGAGGAQPLTAPRFVTDSVGLSVDPHSIRLRMRPWMDRVWLR